MTTSEVDSMLTLPDVFGTVPGDRQSILPLADLHE